MTDFLDADLAVDKNDVNKIVRKSVFGPNSRSSFLNGWMPPHPTFFVRKEIYQKYRLFNPDMGTAADYELMLRFLEKHKCRVAYLPQTIIKMHTGGASNTTLKARLKANRMDRKAWAVNGLKPALYTFWP